MGRPKVKKPNLRKLQNYFNNNKYQSSGFTTHNFELAFIPFKLV